MNDRRKTPTVIAYAGPDENAFPMDERDPIPFVEVLAEYREGILKLAELENEIEEFKDYLNDLEKAIKSRSL